MSPLILELEECETRHCGNVTVNNDMTLEKVESFYVYGDTLYGWIINAMIDGEIKIIDDDEGKNLYT